MLIADGRVLWTSGATGGGVCLALADGTELWKNPRIGETGRFAFPTGRRAIGGIVYGDVLGAWSTFYLADGSNASVPDIGDMPRRGHHIRCFAGKATERFLILPHRGAEFVTERDLGEAELTLGRDTMLGRIQDQYATGYDMDGARADLLVSDGTDLYMMKSKVTLALEAVPVRRTQWTGLTPMGGKYLMANFGSLNDTMFHRLFWVHDDVWPGYSTGTGYAARAGNLIVLGAERAYAAKHFEGGWYPTHQPGSGNRIVADGYGHSNTAGNRTTLELRKELGVSPNAAAWVRTAPPLWDATVGIIVRAMLVAPDSDGEELVFTAGIVEGTTQAEWHKSTYDIGPGRLMVHAGTDGRPLAEYDLPACPVFDGLSADDGRVFVSLVDGQIACFRSTIANGSGGFQASREKVPQASAGQAEKQQPDADLDRRNCEKMGLAPSRNGENPGKSKGAELPVPVFSQPRSAQ